MSQNQENSTPQNQEAEASVLGAAMLAAAAFAVVVTQLEPTDFHRPSHRAIAAALLRMWDRGERKADPVLVADELRTTGDLDAIGGASYLLTLVTDTPATTNADRYAAIIQEKSLMRRIVQAGQGITDLGYSSNDVARALTDAKAMITNLDIPVEVSDPSPNIDEFLAMETKFDWLVPGLIERGDRLMLTAAEGAGKSTLIRQMAVQFASGIQPWEARFFEPIRVLVIDVENSKPQIQRQLRPLKSKAGENLDPDNLRIEVRMEGLDLTSRHDARWLFERVAVNRPDVVTIGPVYKLHADDPNDEQPARQVAKVLDEIRNRYGCALLIEAHSPKGTPNKRPLAPFGASLWMRWPEFGYGLRPTKLDDTKFKFEEWRGPRDVRSWPKAIRRGGEWPWTVAPETQRLV